MRRGLAPCSAPIAAPARRRSSLSRARREFLEAKHCFIVGSQNHRKRAVAPQDRPSLPLAPASEVCEFRQWSPGVLRRRPRRPTHYRYVSVPGTASVAGAIASRRGAL